MMQFKLNNRTLLSLFFVFLTLVILSTMIVFPNRALAAGKFTIDAKINLKNLNNPQKLKVVAFSNGENKTKYLTGNDLKSNTATASFQFNQKNNLVTVGHNDEYFVCAYDINAQTNEMKSYSCIEGNMENPTGKNPVNIGSGPDLTSSTGKFKPVNGAVIKNPTVVVWLENLAGKKDLKNIGVVAMIKGELRYKIIDARKLLQQSNDKTIRVPLHFGNESELGPFRVGDMLFGCVSANVLNPTEGTECEHRVTSHTGQIHNIIARHD